MEMSPDTKEKITQLQQFEQSLHQFFQQKQQFQSQILELENALKEMEAAQGTVYKIVGAVMLHADKVSLAKDLAERRDVLALRVKNVEKQEHALKERAEKIQQEVMEEIEKRMKNDNGKAN